MKQNGKISGHMVFGLDIGTRSIVGTVGYQTDTQFIVVAQAVEEHTTRSMLDGQIHDIPKVSETILKVKETLEHHTKQECKEVCIAAAGRVLQTITTSVTLELESEREITQEDVYSVESLGVERAYEEFSQENNSPEKFFCVGHSIIRYYMNDFPISNLIGHKATRISTELIATFLPNDVVDGLYQAVELAGLEVVNLTLEPIAAMHVAIPEKYRMLNIALVDVGAGTSDICITKSGSIVAYGMIPCAGDSITEAIAQHCLVDFQTAESIKKDAGEMETISYDDILLLPQSIGREELYELTKNEVDSMAKQVADKIMELNGDKTVSAVFVIGGGGKYGNYVQTLAQYLELPEERVALRGFEVMQDIVFMQKSIEKDSMLVTPVGICLSFYEHNNNFLYVSFNGKKIKLYDNGQLSIVDVIMQAGITNEDIFPKRGTPIHYKLDGVSKIARGERGEPAVITINGEVADLHASIKAGDSIVLTESTAGRQANLSVKKFLESKASITVHVNDQAVELPMFVLVNQMLQSEFYEIQEQDEIELLNYYTVEQVLECMDLLDDLYKDIYVNHTLADRSTKVYDQFSVRIQEVEKLQNQEKLHKQEGIQEITPVIKSIPKVELWRNLVTEEEVGENEESVIHDIYVMINGTPIHLSGKKEYVFVDIFDVYEFDLTPRNGKEIITKLNQQGAKYLEAIRDGDVIELGWKDIGRA